MLTEKQLNKLAEQAYSRREKDDRWRLVANSLDEARRLIRQINKTDANLHEAINSWLDTDTHVTGQTIEDFLNSIGYAIIK